MHAQRFFSYPGQHSPKRASALQRPLLGALLTQEDTMVSWDDDDRIREHYEETEEQRRLGLFALVAVIVVMILFLALPQLGGF